MKANVTFKDTYRTNACDKIHTKNKKSVKRQQGEKT
jgi:hypothetical protein